MRQPVAAVSLRGCIGQGSPPPTDSRRADRAVFLRIIGYAVWLTASLWGSAAAAQDADQASLAAYADAANFQNNGAIDLAIDAWQKFLKQYPEDPLAAEAAHYLGVCFMQAETPDHPAAAAAFARALKNKEYKLREETLANRGWCLYAAAGQDESRDPKLLEQALQTFRTLLEENPQSRYRDRAFFYSGEAAYGLGNPEQAIESYDQLLALADADVSPLRCDAFYARGVAQEDLERFDQAITSYEQLLAGCQQKRDLVIDVHMRIGNLRIRRGQYDEAAQAFDDAIGADPPASDRAYALFRMGYALAQSERPGEAAAKYEQLLEDHPDSPYAAAALLASAQSSYRSGDLDQAAERFEKVLAQKDRAAATEAAHWLARIQISKAKPTEAERICRQQLTSGLEGEYAVALRLDLAEAVSMNPATVADSLVLFEQAYRDAPDDALAPRALYNAAFSAYQIGKPERALELALEFINRFPQDTLVSDIRFVAAECQLQTGKAEAAADTYRKLMSEATADNMQRPLWLLRAAATFNAAGRYDETVKMLGDELEGLAEPPRRAEAQFLIGQAHLAAGRAQQAADAFEASRKTDPQGARAAEAALRSAEAMAEADDAAQAQAIWQQLIERSPETRAADRARYRLAQAAGQQGDFERAVGLYDEILESGKDPSLTPHTLYGKGWALMQIPRYEAALEPLDRMLREHPDHAVHRDARLARGITLRNLGRLDDARIDLDAFLETSPEGHALGHALYELALIDQQQKQPQRAADKLKRLVDQVPDYPDLENVLYELGWSHRESGDDDAAVAEFTELIRRFGDSPLAAEAAYFVGQQAYASQDWSQAAEQFRIAAERSDDADLSEKAFYRLGWALYKLKQYEPARAAFAQQAERHPDGNLILDALLMTAECDFRSGQFQPALESYQAARERIRQTDDNADSIRDRADRQIRELVLLHGGQSAGQMKQWKQAIGWFDELRQRFPATTYLPQAFYETGFAYQQLDQPDKAIDFFAQVANKYRSETAARARFMIGEIHFAEKRYDLAIPEFQRVMFGFGAEKAAENVKNWQAKSGYEAGRCSELLIQKASSQAGREKASRLAREFFSYVVDKHPDHELAAKSRERLEALKSK